MQHETAWPAARPRAAAGSTARTDRLRAHGGLAVLLALTTLLYVWGLSRSGYGNDFYAAAVKAGTQSWKAFFFGSLDPSNFITVDKPPASLWVMELSGRIFGFSSWSMLLPQALMGVASVGLLYATVRRWFSTPAALLSGAILALTPVAALMFRFNNPDALLVLLFVAAGYATTRALERAGTWWLALAGAVIGLGFLTKMMQAFVVLPALALAYLIAAPASPLRRLWQIGLAGLAMVLAGGWWVAIVELWPAASRPYIGGSTDNSILDLIWGYNGVGRIAAGSTGPGGANFSGPPGLLRLFNSELGGQIGWLIPAALIVLVAGLWATRRAPRVDRTRAALILWGTWLLAGGLVYSFMSGVIHPYYSNTLAPAIAVLVGVGATALWQSRRSIAARLLLAALAIVTAVWSYTLLDRSPDWHPLLRFAVLAAGIGFAVAIVAAGVRLTGPWPAGLAAAGLVAGLTGPAAFTLSTSATAHTGSLPAAGPVAASGPGAGGFAGPRAGGFAPPGGGFAPPGGGRPTGGRPPGLGAAGPRGGGFGGARGGGGATTSTALTALVKQSASGYTWVAAADSAGTAAPIELSTGRAVMAIGGFNGGDQAITLSRFEQLVAAGRIHYYIAGGTGGGGPGGRAGSSTEIASWVADTFRSTTVGGTTVYDLTQTAS